MAKDDYNWLDDPFDPEKQAHDEEELTRAKSNGLLILTLVIIAAIVVGVLVFFFGSIFLDLCVNGFHR